MAVKHLLLSILIIFSIITISSSSPHNTLTISTSQQDDLCVYTVYVKTGSHYAAATDSKISFTVWDKKGYGVFVKDLVSWGGIMGKGYNYFELRSIDIFSGRGPCLTGPVCELELTTDSTGRYPGWFCDYVQVYSASLNSGCSSKHFNVSKWLEPTVGVNECGLIKRPTKSTTSVL